MQARVKVKLSVGGPMASADGPTPPKTAAACVALLLAALERWSVGIPLHLRGTAAVACGIPAWYSKHPCMLSSNVSPWSPLLTYPL